MKLLWIEDGGFTAVRQGQLRAMADVMGCDIRMVSPEKIAHVPALAVVDVRQDLFDMPPERQVAAWMNYIVEGEFVAVLASHTPQKLRILSRLAAAFEAPFYSGLLTSSLPACMRSICANRLLETLPMPSQPFFATLAQSQVRTSGAAWRVDSVLKTPYQIEMAMLEHFEAFEKSRVSIDRARVVFAGGMGLGTKENFEKLAQCAEKFGAGLASSRLAVDLGWCRNDLQVGQTGRSIAPELYVAFGISGAIQHLAGIQNARRIFAINRDKNAPIFAYSDMGFVGDACALIAHLLEI